MVVPSWASQAQLPNDSLVPFRYRATDEALADLKHRLEGARWPERETGSGWDQGVPLAALRGLVEYWRSGYDWRRCESELRRMATEFQDPRIDGLDLHFIHVRSRHPNALPIVLTHGWPSTIVLFSEVIGPLSDPTAHGGTASDAFDVVIPSLPGFGFSEKPVERGWNAERTARAWGVLMQRLGYARYVAQGGETGVRSLRPQWRNSTRPGLAAIHLNFAQTVPDVIPANLLPDQKRAVAVLNRVQREGSAGFPAAIDATADYRLRACGLAGWAGRLDLRHLQ